MCPALSHEVNLLYPTLQLQNVVYNFTHISECTCAMVHVKLNDGDVASTICRYDVIRP